MQIMQFTHGRHWWHNKIPRSKLFLPCISSCSLLLHVPKWCHHSSAFSMHSVIRLGHYSSHISQLQSQDHRPRSNPSSYSDTWSHVDLFCGVFHSCLKTLLFSKSYPPQRACVWQIWNYDQSMFGSHWQCSIGKCSRSRQPG